MSLEQYKDANRAELWDILQIQVQVLQSEIELTTELRKQITELEQQLEQYHAVKTWGQYFTMDELKAHNLAQEIKAVSALAEDLEWLDSKSENNDPPSSVTANELRAFAKKLKEQE